MVWRSHLPATPPPTIPELGEAGDVIIRALVGGATLHNGTKTSGPSQTLSDAAAARAINPVLATHPPSFDLSAPPPAWYARSFRASLSPFLPVLVPPLPIQCFRAKDRGTLFLVIARPWRGGPEETVLFEQSLPHCLPLPHPSFPGSKRLACFALPAARATLPGSTARGGGGAEGAAEREGEGRRRAEGRAT